MSIDSISQHQATSRGLVARRPTISGTRHAVSAGHYLATTAAFQILESGGNAIDAGVAAGIVLSVVQSELVNFAGVAPIMIYVAARREVVTIAGLGGWPAAMTPTLFEERHNGKIPQGLLRTVVPAAPDAWITALELYGTLSFADVAGAAISLARGFVMYPLMSELVTSFAADYRQWDSNAAIYLPDGEPPNVGKVFRQTDLANLLQFMADEGRSASKNGRGASLAASRRAFYSGDIAAAIVEYHARNGGLLRASDLRGFRSEVAPPVSTDFGQTKVYGCGAWCQGPTFLQMLNIAQAGGVRDLAHNSLGYVHLLTEAMKLSFADRHAFFGDPAYVNVPLQRLLSLAYAGERARLIAPDRACPGLPEPGGGYRDPAVYQAGGDVQREVPCLDTSYVCVSDKWGNVFSATPSDTSFDTPVIPGLGICPSSRGSQSWANPLHPSSVAPGKRPRLTPNPAMAIDPDGRVLAFGTPGGDVQTQAMLQVFLNLELFGMDHQEAVEAPRFATYSFPDSFEPHSYFPGRLLVEHGVGSDVAMGLSERGHDVAMWPDGNWRAGAVCLVDQRANGLRFAAADPRRPSYALGW
jgi:gamma-glutamyltranspeptidase/glutathione hydrolase